MGLHGCTLPAAARSLAHSTLLGATATRSRPPGTAASPPRTWFSRLRLPRGLHPAGPSSPAVFSAPSPLPARSDPVRFPQPSPAPRALRDAVTTLRGSDSSAHFSVICRKRRVAQWPRPGFPYRHPWALGQIFHKRDFVAWTSLTRALESAQADGGQIPVQNRPGRSNPTGIQAGTRSPRGGEGGGARPRLGGRGSGGSDSLVEI